MSRKIGKTIDETAVAGATPEYRGVIAIGSKVSEGLVVLDHTAKVQETQAHASVRTCVPAGVSERFVKTVAGVACAAKGLDGLTATYASGHVPKTELEVNAQRVVGTTAFAAGFLTAAENVTGRKLDDFIGETAANLIRVGASTALAAGAAYGVSQNLSVAKTLHQ